MASAAGRMARRVEGAYSTEIYDRDATKPDGPPRRKTPRSTFQTRSEEAPQPGVRTSAQGGRFSLGIPASLGAPASGRPPALAGWAPSGRAANGCPESGLSPGPERPAPGIPAAEGVAGANRAGGSPPVWPGGLRKNCLPTGAARSASPKTPEIIVVHRRRLRIEWAQGVCETWRQPGARRISA
jgi:hypothetical protein